MRPVLLVLALAGCNNSDKPPEETGDAPPVVVDDDNDGSPAGEDCDDANPNVSPELSEACDGLDTDCDAGTGEDGLVTAGFTTSSDLQALLDGASVGDVVSVCAGLWEGPFDARLAVTIRGVAGPEATIFQGVAGGPALTLAGGEVGGVTITAGTRGVEIDDGATVLVANVIISAFDAGSEDGGGMVIGAGAHVTLDAVTLTGNTALRGGGVVVGEGATLEMTESFVDGNTATELGGGMLVYPGATITGGTVRQNAAVRGGGLALLGDATLGQMLISYNNATLAGGGAHSDSPGPLALTDVLFTANTAEPLDQETTEGGGIYADSTVITLDGESTLTLNVALLGGGIALHNGGSVTGGLVLANVGLLQGGGVYVTTGADVVTISGTTLQTNRSVLSGGGLQIATGAVVGADLVFEANDGGAAGGGFALAANTELTLTGGSVITNVATVGGGGSMLGFDADASTLTLTDVTFGAGAEANTPAGLQIGTDVYDPSGLTTLACASDRGCQ